MSVIVDDIIHTKQEVCSENSSTDSIQEAIVHHLLLEEDCADTQAFPGPDCEETQLLQYLESVSPSKLRLYTESIKRMHRLRLRLMDPLLSIASHYNKDAGNGSLRELVERTDDFAATCVASYANFQTSSASGFYPRSKDVVEAMVPMLEESVQSALAEFYLELSCLLSDCDSTCGNNVLHSVLVLGCMDIKDILACCYQAARNNVRKKLHMWEID